MSSITFSSARSSLQNYASSLYREGSSALQKISALGKKQITEAGDFICQSKPVIASYCSSKMQAASRLFSKMSCTARDSLFSPLKRIALFLIAHKIASATIAVFGVILIVASMCKSAARSTSNRLPQKKMDTTDHSIGPNAPPNLLPQIGKKLKEADDMISVEVVQMSVRLKIPVELNMQIEEKGVCGERAQQLFERVKKDPASALPCICDRFKLTTEVKLNFVFKAPQQSKTFQPVDLVLCIDVSGSMNRKRIQTVALAVQSILGTITEEIKRKRRVKFGIVEFNESARVTIPIAPLNEESVAFIKKKIAKKEILHCDGTTDLICGFSLAEQQFSSYDFLAPTSRGLVLLTDGEDDLGNKKKSISEIQQKLACKRVDFLFIQIYDTANRMYDDVSGIKSLEKDLCHFQPEKKIDAKETVHPPFNSHYHAINSSKELPTIVEQISNLFQRQLAEKSVIEKISFDEEWSACRSPVLPMNIQPGHQTRLELVGELKSATVPKSIGLKVHYQCNGAGGVEERQISLLS